ncbi:hypothetical protein Ddye_026860 [Dipteronia dyeriana]|uniref:DUF1985 domain-containing protein n=1 Tax=Dipteronia dyeriana TaxID=168575 RepID=A0AAD9TN19_9ROSI|nr:hypothetical protein Ddye_026860 [Dipteronia dyeriana]
MYCFCDIADDEQVEELLKTPEGYWFKRKLTRHDHFEALACIDDALNRVPEEFAVEDRHHIMAFSFRHFMSMHRELKFSGGVIHQLLLWESDHDGPIDEMRFLLGNHVVRFLKVEFNLITGLHFGVVADTSMYVIVENGIHQRYFPGHDEVLLDDLKVVLTRGEFQQVYDAVKLGLIYMLNWILMGVDERLKIPVWQFRLVDDLNAFNAFLWVIYFRGDPPTGCRFQDSKVTNLSPRMLKWKLTKQHRGKKLDKIFSARDDRVHLPTVSIPTINIDRSEEKGGGGRCSETDPSDPTGADFSGMDTGRFE